LASSQEASTGENWVIALALPVQLPPHENLPPEVLCSHKNPAKHFIRAEHYDGKLARAYGLMIGQQLCQQIVVTVHGNGVPWQMEQ
jgi:hypothetical protein